MDFFLHLDKGGSNVKKRQKIMYFANGHILPFQVLSQQKKWLQLDFIHIKAL